MSCTVNLGHNIICSVRSATMRTIFGYLRDHEPDHTEFRALVDEEEYFDAIGGWFLDKLSPDALQLLQRLMSEMAQDLPATAAKTGWNEDWKPIFHADIERIRASLADRIAQSNS